MYLNFIRVIHLLRPSLFHSLTILSDVLLNAHKTGVWYQKLKIVVMHKEIYTGGYIEKIFKYPVVKLVKILSMQINL